MLNIKSLIFGVLLVAPAVAALVYRDSEKAVSPSQMRAISYPQHTGHQSGEVVHVPIEVIQKGGAPQTVYVEASTRAVPEPGVFALLTFASLILVRRQRK
ncbi:MAG: hypothetical protein ABI162_01720 [Luteolibacter sp.]